MQGPFLRPKSSHFSGGATDTFEFSCINLGIVTSIVLSHDDAGLLSSWVPSHVCVDNLLTLRSAIFWVQRRLENHVSVEIYASPAALEDNRRTSFLTSPSPNVHLDLTYLSAPASPVALGASSTEFGANSAMGTPLHAIDINGAPKSVLLHHDQLHIALAAAVNKLVRYYSLRADPALYLPEDVVSLI
jgi:hypothetical protein